MPDKLEDLYSLLVPLNGNRLIVPRACVGRWSRKLEMDPWGWTGIVT